jgi:hypothetical protein
MPTFNIPEQNMDRLKSKLEKIQRKIDKLNAGSLTWKETGEEYWEQTHDKHGVKLFNPIVRRNVIIEVEGESPQVEGWTFVGTIQHLENGNILRTVLEYSGPDIPIQYRTADQSCDHCRVFRYRIDTYLLVKEGEFKQVGRNCLADFLGGLSPEAAASCCTYLSEVSEIFDEESDFYAGGDNHGRGYLPVKTFLLRALEVIHTFGWYSRTKASEDWIKSTADRVLDTFYNNVYWTPKMLESLKRKPEDTETVKEALEWIRNMSDEEIGEQQSYLWNLKIACSSEYVPNRAEGIVASLFGAYDRNSKHIEKKEVERTISQYVGKVGKRAAYVLSLRALREFEGMYGLKTMHRFVDEAGNVFVWFKTGETNMEIDRTYHIIATVKNHEEYHGVEQTVITRCKEL